MTTGATTYDTQPTQPAGGPVAWQRSDVNIVTGEWSVWRHDDYPHEDLDPKRAMRRPLYAHGITATKGER